jgi:lysophospholipase L1-like esterase
MNFANRAAGQKTAHTLLCFVALSLAPYFVPGLERLRVLVPTGLLIAASRQPQATSPQATAASSSQAHGSGGATQAESKPGEIEDPSGRALAHFFSSLNRVEREGGQVRISHYGDSPITGDMITSTVRRKLQQQFGDAGHGFVLLAKPWGWYEHVGVRHEAKGWQSEPMFISKGDHRFGFGGASFISRAAGAAASFAAADEGEIEHSVSAFDIYYLAQPGGGEFDVEVDGAHRARVSTAADEIRSGFHRVNVGEGARTMTIRTVGNGEVRAFGVVLESSQKGVSYDSLGVNGAFVGLLANYLDERHWAEQLKHRRPDLVILAYGANESEYEDWPMEQYEKDTREVVRRVRAALPEASILFVGPMDRGKRGAGGAIITRPTIPKLVGYQRRLAAELGCAFFDTFTAMGGEGTAARWYEAKPRLMGGDLTHPTWAGSEIVGTLIHDALIKAYEKSQRPQGALVRTQ